MLYIRRQAQLDKEEKDENHPMLMARMDELLEEASPLKNALLLMALNKEYRKLMETTVKFDDECKKNKCHELEIDIVR